MVHDLVRSRRVLRHPRTYRDLVLADQASFYALVDGSSTDIAGGHAVTASSGTITTVSALAQGLGRATNFNPGTYRYGSFWDPTAVSWGVEFWFSVTTAGAHPAIWSKGPSTSTYGDVKAMATARPTLMTFQDVVGASEHDWWIGAAPGLNTPHHLFMAFNASTSAKRVWLDGVDQAVSNTQAVASDTNELWLGSSGAAFWAGFQGSISDFAVYLDSAVLSDQRVKAHYAAATH